MTFSMANKPTYFLTMTHKTRINGLCGNHSEVFASLKDGQPI